MSGRDHGVGVATFLDLFARPRTRADGDVNKMGPLAREDA